MQQAVVIGSGPAGLACAAELGRRGVDAVVLEQGAVTAAAWAGRYDAFRFNTWRGNSALPGVPFPRQYGWFPDRDQYVGYLHDYAQTRRVRVQHHTEVVRLDQAPGESWTLTTNRGKLCASNVIVAAGVFNRPTLPSWAEEHDFSGRLVHAADYRNATPFRDERVLVVGAGSTGLEIANQLAGGGADEVFLAVRTPPNILLRVIGGLPADLPLPLLLRLPPRVVDAMLRALQRRVIGDLSEYGLGRPAEGPMAGLKRRGAGTAIVDREVLDKIVDGGVRVVAAVDRLTPRGAVLADGAEVRVDAVIAATGYRTGLAPMIGHLGVLNGREMPLDGRGAELLPGLRCVGYVYRPGLTRYVGFLARRVAREVSQRPRHRRAPGPDVP